MSLTAPLELVAQLVEHDTFNVGVVGSSPTGLTLKTPQMTNNKTLRKKRLDNCYLPVMGVPVEYWSHDLVTYGGCFGFDSNVGGS